MTEAVQIKPRFRGLTRVMRMLDRVEDMETRDGMTALGAVVESQIRRRISHEKTSPDGRRWKPWSRDYAETRHSNHSLLVNTGHMLESIEYDADDRSVAIGSNMIYAARQNHDRPFIGVGPEDAREIEETIEDFVAGEVGR